MNPMNFMHLKPLIEQFHERHPKFVEFFGYAGQHIEEDSLLEISITDPSGSKIVTNIRITQEDLEFVEQLRQTLE